MEDLLENKKDETITVYQAKVHILNKFEHKTLFRSGDFPLCLSI
jgi:hypothetical protein